MLNQRPLSVSGFSMFVSFFAVLAISMFFPAGCTQEIIISDAPTYAEGINPDLVLWYSQPAADRDQALPVGNGRLGAMVYGGIKSERIQLNENTILPITPMPPEVPEIRDILKQGVEMIANEEYLRAHEKVTKKFLRCKLQPCDDFGELKIDFKGIGTAAGYQRKLDLQTGVASAGFRHNGATYSRKVFASKPDQIVVVRLTCDQPGKISFSATLGSQLMNTKVTIASNDRIILSGMANETYCPLGVVPGLNGADKSLKRISFESQLKVNAIGGTVSSDDTGIHVEDADEVTLLVSADTSFRGPGDGDPEKPVNPSVQATMNIIQASAKAPELMIKDHIADHKNRFCGVTLHLAEPSRQSLLATDLRIKSVNYYKDVIEGRVKVQADKELEDEEIIKVAKDILRENNSLAVLFFQYWRYLMIAGPVDMAGLTELENSLNKMLFKDDGEDLHILPALPKAWPTGKVKGLTTYAGFKADIEWAGGKHVQTLMRSELGKSCNICYGEHTITRQSNPGEVIRLNGPLVITVLKTGKEVEKKISHRFLKSGWKSGSVSIIGADGKVEWEYGTDDETTDSWYLGDGKVIFSHKDGVTLVGKDKGTIWTYDAPTGKENHSCQPIEDGKFLVGENGDGAWIIELNGDGTPAKKIKVSDHKDKRHAFRQVRKTPQGTYLATIMTQNKTYEWDAEGKLLRTFPNGHYVAIRLKNGNTLTSGNPNKGGWHIAEFNDEGKVVWSLSDKDDIGLHVNMVCGMHRLENGNTVVANMLHGKNSDPEAPQIFEITPDKKVVWKVKNPKLNRVGSIQILDTEDKDIDNARQQR